jgi:hypothetical protein
MRGGAPGYRWEHDLDPRLAGIVRDDWFPRPRRDLGYWETHALTMVERPLQLLAATGRG